MYVVLGATGYLGSYFVSHLKNKGEEVRGLTRQEINYTDLDNLLTYLRSIKPKFLI